MVGAYNRDVSCRKAIRKKRISEQWYWGKSHPYYDNLHQFSKNKIHCSCPNCSQKTRNKGRRRYAKGNYYPALNYRASDLRKQIAMDYDEYEATGKPIPRRRNRW